MIKLWLALIFVSLVLGSDEKNGTKENLEPESIENDRNGSTTKNVERTTRKFDDFKFNNGTQTTNSSRRVKTQAQINKFVSWKVNYQFDLVSVLRSTSVVQQSNSKNYVKSADSAKAEDNFIENDERIQRFNKLKNRTYEQGHNKYSDQSYAENKKYRTGLRVPDDESSTGVEGQVKNVSSRVGFSFSEVSSKTTLSRANPATNSHTKTTKLQSLSTRQTRRQTRTRSATVTKKAGTKHRTNPTHQTTARVSASLPTSVNYTAFMQPIKDQLCNIDNLKFAEA